MKKGILLGLMALLIGILPSAGALASSYNGTTVSPESDGKTYNVVANSGDTVTLADVGAAKGQIAITFGASVNGSITVAESSTKPGSAPTDAPGHVSTYYDVTLVGLSNADITSAKWRFNVNKDWLTQKGVASTNVFLHHYGTSWERLTTAEVSSSTTSHTFEANVTSFSPFAVTAVEGLSNTGSPYMIGALIAAGILATLGGTFVLSRKSS